MKKKSKVCITCGHEYNDDWYKLNQPISKNNKSDIKMAKEYCKSETTRYNHKNCKPVWCDECQFLEGYVVNY